MGVGQVWGMFVRWVYEFGVWDGGTGWVRGVGRMWERHRVGSLCDVRSAFKIKLKNINKKGMVTMSRVFIS